MEFGKTGCERGDGRKEIKIGVQVLDVISLARAAFVSSSWKVVGGW